MARGEVDGRLPRRSGIEVVELTADDSAVADAVKAANVVVCATSSPAPLFDASLLRDDAVIIAVGSHSPDATEIDPRFCARAAVVVEEPAAALRECGEIVQAQRLGALTSRKLVPIAAVVAGHVAIGRDRPLLFKGAGTAWEDLVVARAIVAVLPA